MKLRIGRKRSHDPLRPLTEREIQARLYGSLREGTASVDEARGSERDEPGPGNQTLVLDWPERKAGWRQTSERLGKLLFRGGTSSAAFVKDLAGRKGLAGLLAVSIALLLFLSVHALNLYRAAAMKNPKKVPAQVLSRQIESERRPASLGSAPITPEAGPAVQEAATKAPPTPRVPAAPPVVEQKGYVVQVCTYAREEDAQRLVVQMSEAGLPAFHKPLQRPSGKTFYSVFLGRYKTYREAQGKLQEFRGNPMAHEFPDVFVRSL